MKLSIERRLALFFAAIFTALLIIGIVAYKNNQAFTDTTNVLRHALGVVNTAEKVVSLMKDIETGERGYIITGDKEFLQPTDTSRKAIAFQLDSLKKLTMDAPSQKAKFDSLSLYINDKMNFVDHSILLISANKQAEAESLIASKQGKRIMDNIRRTIQAIEDEENSTLAQKRAVRQKSIDAMQNMLIFFVAGLCTLLIIVFFTIRTALYERKKHAENMQRTNTFLDTILENIPNMIFVKDAKELRFVRFNKAGEKLLGYPREDLLGKNDYDFFPKEEADFFTLKDREVIQKNELEDIPEESIQTKEGQRWLHTKKLPITDAEGHPRFLMGISEDITERKEAEELLRDSERQVQTIFAAAPDAIIVIDDKGLVSRWNSKAEKIFGWSAAEMLGKPLAGSIIPEKYREMHSTGMEKFISTGVGPVLNQTIEMPAIRKDGSEFFVELTISNTKLKGKHIFIGFLKDITERKRKDDRIKQLNGQLENTIELLQASNKEMEAFTYSVSHDLRAPLRIINGFAEILVSDYAAKLDEEGLYNLNVIMNNSRQMGQLIDDLLNLSRLGRAALDKKTVNMEELVQEVMAGMEFINPDIKSEIKFNGLRPALCDPSLIKQVWTNLISNADKYSRKKEKQEIEIGSMIQDDKVVYYVKDNGVGFDMQYAGKLFGVFQRLHKVSEFEGTGVGLAIVHRIINKHGGRIWADAKENKGATFYFTLS